MRVGTIVCSCYNAGISFAGALNNTNNTTIASKYVSNRILLNQQLI